MSDEINLDTLWTQIESEPVDKQVRIDAASRSGQSGDLKYVPHILRLLTDPVGEVRYYALQALVLDLKQKDEGMKARCWNLLRRDPDEDVRSMAAACLGSAYFGSLDSEAYDALEDVLRDPQETAFVKEAVYTALFELVGKPPMEWPGLKQLTRTPFQESDIDWSKVAEFRSIIEKEREAG